MTTHAVFVTPDLFVQFVGKPVDGSIHVGIRILGEQGFAGCVNRSFSLLLLGLFNFENDINRYHVIEVS